MKKQLNDQVSFEVAGEKGSGTILDKSVSIEDEKECTFYKIKPSCKDKFLEHLNADGELWINDFEIKEGMTVTGDSQ